MNTVPLALAVTAVLVVSAACYSWAGDPAQFKATPPSDVRGGDTVAFVEGAEAEPPALPDGTPMPAPRTAAAHAAAPAKPKEVSYVTPESVKKHPPRLHPVAADSVASAAPSAKPVHASALTQWND